jgi:acylphosphatase
MGLFDTLFSSVTGGSREPQKPSNAELELRRRLTVLASDEATQDAPQRYFLRWEGQVQGVGFRFTNTNLAQARSLTGWVRNMEDGSVEMELQGTPANIVSHLEALHASYERMGTRFRLVDAQTRAPLANEDDFIPRY